MGRIGVICATLIALWAAWWPIAAAFERRATLGWLEAQRAAGWQAEAGDVSVSGFPLRYTRSVAAPALADPARGWAWRAERVALTRARHPQLADPGTTLTLPLVQSLRTPYQRVSIAAETLTATIIEAPQGDILDRARIELAGVRLVSDAEWDAALDSGTLSASANASDPRIVTLVLEAAGLTPPSRIADALSSAELAPRSLDRLRAQAEVTFGSPWTMSALESARPQPRRIVLREAGVAWGALTLRVAGTLEIDALGQPTGELLVKATNWREILAASVASGLVPERLAGALEAALDLMSRLAGRSETLDIPVRIAEGRVWLGPVRIGTAPVLRLP